MNGKNRDPGLDHLLDLDGQVLVVDPAGNFWVRFSVNRVPTTPAKSHGLDYYSLTLHDKTGARLIGFDNAHPVQSSSGSGARKKKEFDHRHRLRVVKPYDYKNAADLLADFRIEVDRVLRENGVIS